MILSLLFLFFKKITVSLSLYLLFYSFFLLLLFFFLLFFSFLFSLSFYFDFYFCFFEARQSNCSVPSGLLAIAGRHAPEQLGAPFIPCFNCNSPAGRRQKPGSCLQKQHNIHFVAFNATYSSVFNVISF